jgi:hypothetical protein
MVMAIQPKGFITGDRNLLASHREKTQGMVRPDELIPPIEEIRQVPSFLLWFKQDHFDHDTFTKECSLVRELLCRNGYEVRGLNQPLIQASKIWSRVQQIDISVEPWGTHSPQFLCPSATEPRRDSSLSESVHDGEHKVERMSN